MEAPPNPMPFEYGEGDKDKKEKSDKKKKTLRIPLPASEVHTSEPKSFERLLPLFEKKDEGASKVDNDKTGLAARDARPSPFAPSKPEQAAPADQPGGPVESSTADDIVTPHEDLSEIHDTLWSEFESANAQAAIHEPSHAERTIGAGVAAPETDEHQATDASLTPKPETSSVDSSEITEHEHRIDHNELTIPAPEAVHYDVGQEHAIDLNAPIEHTHELRKPVVPEDAVPSAPSAAGLNAEVAATEPDQESVRLWEEFDAAPQARAPEWHPESQPLDTDEQFSDIMQRADMDKQFISDTSDQVVAVPQPITTYGLFNTTAPTPVEATPYIPTAPAAEQQTNVVSATGNEGPDWYPPRHNSISGSSLLRSAAEAGVVGGALAGAGAAAGAAHAAETGGLLAGGAAAGTIAGGVTGHAAGEHAARQNTAQELQQAQQQAEQTRLQHEQQITALNNQHRTAQEHISRLTQDNQRLAEQQRPAAEAPAIVSAPAEAAKPEQEMDTSKTVHSEWVDTVIDKRTGQLAKGPGVNEFGSEYYAEQRAETVPATADPLTIALAAAKAAARTAMEVTDAYEQEHGQPMQHGYAAAAPPPAMAPPLPSGQITEQSHELSAGPQPADYQHRLPAPQNQVKAVLANPLVWAGVTILVLAFLAAVFI